MNPFAGMHTALFDGPLGEDAWLDGSAEKIRIIFTEDATATGEYGEIVGRLTVADIKRTDGAEKDMALIVGGNHYRLDRMLEDGSDQFVGRWVLRLDK